jgi:hypothetical protein
MARKNRTNPWLDKKWHLISASGLSLPLLLLRGKKDSSGNKTARPGDNQFRLTVGSRTGKRINFFRLKARKNTVSRYWGSCVLVPRGHLPVQLIDENGAPLAPLRPSPTDQEVQDLADKLIAAINKGHSVSSSRLECDVEVHDPGNPQKKVYGLLRLFQVPRAVGSKPLLITDVSMDGGLPGGNGGGGSIHN